MKFSNATVLALALVSTATAFQPIAVASRQAVMKLASSAAEVEEPRRVTKKDNRLRMMKSPRFHRRGFKEVREDAEQRLEDEYMSGMVKDLRTSNYVMERDGVKVYLAKVRINPQSNE
jgi:4-hydroxy-3-methylbut-2-enyl diphosphate reductase